MIAAFQALVRRLLAQVPGGLGRQAIFVALGDAITFSCSLIGPLLLARLLTTDDMGTYRQVAYLGAMLAALVDGGVSATIYRFWKQLAPPSRSEYARLITGFSFGVGALGTALLYVGAPLLARWYHNPGLAHALRVAAPYPLATVPLALVRPVLISQGRSLRATGLETLFGLANILALALPLYLGLDLNQALAVWTAVCLARLVAVPWVLRRHWLPSVPGERRRMLTQLWRYLWPLQVGRIPGLMNAYLDKVVMSFSLNPRSFATYSLGAREIPFLGMLGMSVAAVLLPQLALDVAAGRTDEVCRRWRRACAMTAGATYLAAAFCIVYAAPVMQVLFSATYRDGAPFFRVFAAITFLRVIEYGSLAKAYDQTRIIMKGAYVTVAATVIAAFLLVPRFGGLGMAWAAALSVVASVAYYLVCYRNLLQRPVSDFFPWPRLMLTGAGAFVSVGLVAPLARAWHLEGTVRDGFLAVKLGGVFAASVAVFGAGVWACRQWPRRSAR